MNQIGTLDRGEIQEEKRYWRMHKVERDGSKRKAGKRTEVGETANRKERAAEKPSGPGAWSLKPRRPQGWVRQVR